MGEKRSFTKLPPDYPRPTLEQVQEIVEYNPCLHRDGWDDLPFQHLPVPERLLAMRQSRNYLMYQCHDQVCAALIIFERFGINKRFRGDGLHLKSLMTIYPVMAADDNLTVSYICPGALIVACEYVSCGWRISTKTWQFEFALMLRWYCTWEHWYVTRGLMDYTRPKFYKRYRPDGY